MAGDKVNSDDDEVSTSVLQVKQDHEPLGRHHLQLWYHGCRGVMRHSVCVFSLLDLSTILRARPIVVNKEHQTLALKNKLTELLF